MKPTPTINFLPADWLHKLKFLQQFAHIDYIYYLCTKFQKRWFRSSVGLEQQPSKLWVQGSNPCGITRKRKETTILFPYLFKNQPFTFHHLYGRTLNNVL